MKLERRNLKTSNKNDPRETILESRGNVLNFKIDEGERLVVVTPNAGVLTLEGSEALVMAVLEDGAFEENKNSSRLSIEES
jgi:hypothetical protein